MLGGLVGRAGACFRGGPVIKIWEVSASADYYLRMRCLRFKFQLKRGHAHSLNKNQDLWETHVHVFLQQFDIKSCS